MKARVFTFAAAALLLTTGVFAQPEKRSTIDYTPVTCIKAGEMPVLQMNVQGRGQLKGYFRKVDSAEWCSVDGTNDGPLSRVVLPKFDRGDNIEYFFVILDGSRVLARSPYAYKVRVDHECSLPVARHVTALAMQCGSGTQSIATSMGAGYALDDAMVDGNPDYATPDRPNNQ